MLGFEVNKTGEEVDIDEDEPFLSANSGNSESESEEAEITVHKIQEEDSVWKRLFGDHQMTISDVLQSTPEAQKLKKLNFNLNDNRWGGALPKGKDKKNKNNKNNKEEKEKKEQEEEDSTATSNDNDDDTNTSVNNDTKNTKNTKTTTFYTNSTAPITASFKTPISLESSKLSILDSSGPVEPTFKFGKRKLKKIRKEERDKTKGPGWFNLPAAEMTEERKNDLDALQLRAALDTKHFYKRNNLANRPKYFQVGRILDNPIDFYRSRVPRKQRKRTIAEELMAEAQANGLTEKTNSKRKKKNNN